MIVTATPTVWLYFGNVNIRVEQYRAQPRKMKEAACSAGKLVQAQASGVGHDELRHGRNAAVIKAMKEASEE